MQTQWETLSSIKTSEVAKIAAGIVLLKRELLNYARLHKGSFFIYGSVAKGNYRYDSDIDVLIDFPAESSSMAWRFCEEACRKHGLTPDVRPKTLCSAKFLEKALMGALEISDG
jgi:predicted nucleotidyltransferase